MTTVSVIELARMLEACRLSGTPVPDNFNGLDKRYYMTVLAQGLIQMHKEAGQR